MADALVDQFWQLPGISRTAAAFTFFISALSHTGLLDGSRFYYFGPLVWKMPPQLWRLVTSFCMTGPQLSILFDTYFMYSYMSQLETGHPRMPRKADLLWYLIFVGTVIMVINGYLEFSPFASFLPALLVAMAYTVTQQQQGMKINYFFINIPAPLVPYAMMGVSLLFPGGHLQAIFQGFGLIAAHLYEFLTRIWPQVGGGTNFIPTPPLLERAVHLFQGGAARIISRAYGTAVYPAQGGPGSGAGPSTGSSTGANTGPLPDSWKTRGTGRRLG